ncbi:hypothetical protein AVV40_gp15 [Mycobacterium phage Swirley]|uniref:Uncharacterized protein n=3 Tax=Benedictvirus TaxID=2946819 RepID=A0A0N9SHR3_9CAUD|nr:hypothetical protein AVV40_gp15 [Mycobacterium phage Swirley]YP_009214351.1 hypothetical protein AVU87_gp14 [Mycobacterium phage Theia]YP_009638165.1 hypothetical protein FGG35_gp15 [Mycobacterium phage Cuco]AVR76658.1 hypothetical protein SEA_COOG_76 [Mycobacterium phage Coog]AVR77203.1 hypothetical protein SEA_MIDAS2_76 [Mycobacterium phage Midas2]AXC33353.1 hypothetical protein SEA_DUBLIN_79 [Mycobacterium phage Dublin]QGJ92251.1 hypothetical protein SEA_MARYSWELL_79 [Mycobacterium phag
MHYSHADIMAAAEDLGDRWSKAVIELGPGDTAHSALSSKWDFQGPGTVEYLMHPTGWTVRPSATISKHYKRS